MLKEKIEFEELLRECGEILIQKREEYKNNYKIVGTQVKSQADQHIHDYLIENIRKIKKSAFIVSEEDKFSAAVSEIKELDECIIIDPIDGTSSYIHGYKGYVIQLALMKRGMPVFSIVYAPEFDDMYIASKGEGAYLNGQIMRVNKNPKKTIFIDNYPKPNFKIKKMMECNKDAAYLECGSIGLKICKVAEGQAHLFYKDVVLRDWDLVPPILVLEEAGGLALSLEKKTISYFDNDEYAQQGVIVLADLDMLQNLDCLES